MPLPQISPDSVLDSGAPSPSVAPSSAPSVVPISSVSSPEPVPTPSPTPQPSPSAPAAKPTRTRAASTTQPPAVETPVAPPPPPSSVDSPPVESATYQNVPQPAKPTSQPPSEQPSPSFWVSVNSPTPSSKPPPPVPTISYPDPRASPTKQQQSTTFKTVTNTPVPFGVAPSSGSDSPSKPSKTPDPTAGKGSGVIASSPFDTPSAQSAPKAGKGNGSTVGGVIGGLTAVALVGLLLFFLWKWRARRRAAANKRLSFGPYGNGIDASTGSVLVASVARPEDGSPPLEPINEKYGYIPPPRTRYFQPTVDTGRMLLRPIDSIEELSERGSSDVGKKVGFAGTNPFDDKHAVGSMEPTLPSIDLPEQAMESPERARIRGHHRSRSLGSGQGPQPGTWAPSGYPGGAPQMSSTGVWVPPNMDSGNGQERYKNGPIAPIRRYPTNPVAAKVPSGTMQRQRRSASVSGINRYPPGHNPVLNSPSWRGAGSASPGPGPGRRPSFATREANVPVASSPPTVTAKAPSRKPSTGSLRERPSPTHWIAPDTAHPLHQSPQHSGQQQQQQQPLARSNTRTMRLGPIDKGPELTVGSVWGAASGHMEANKGHGHGDPARNF